MTFCHHHIGGHCATIGSFCWFFSLILPRFASHNMIIIGCSHSWSEKCTSCEHKHHKAPFWQLWIANIIYWWNLCGAIMYYPQKTSSLSFPTYLCIAIIVMIFSLPPIFKQLSLLNIVLQNCHCWILLFVPLQVYSPLGIAVTTFSVFNILNPKCTPSEFDSCAHESETTNRISLSGSQHR